MLKVKSHNHFRNVSSQVKWEKQQLQTFFHLGNQEVIETSINKKGNSSQLACNTVDQGIEPVIEGLGTNIGLTFPDMKFKIYKHIRLSIKREGELSYNKGEEMMNVILHYNCTPDLAPQPI